MAREKREDQTNDNRQNILNAASRLITEKGVKDTSLADIAKEVGISKGTLYYYYSSKNDIIYDITELHLKRVTEELLSWISNIKDDATKEEILTVFFEKVLSAETRGRLHLYLISEVIIDNTAIKEKFIKKYREWRTTIEEDMRRVFKDTNIDYQVLSHIILATLDGFVIERMLGIEKLPLKEVAKFLLS